ARAGGPRRGPRRPSRTGRARGWRDDRGSGRRARGRAVRARGGLLLARDERPDAVHDGRRARERSGRRAGRRAAPGRPPTDPNRRGGGQRRRQVGRGVRRARVRLGGGPGAGGARHRGAECQRTGDPGRQKGGARSRFGNRPRPGREGAAALFRRGGARALRRRRKPGAEPGSVIARADAPRTVLPALTGARILAVPAVMALILAGPDHHSAYAAAAIVFAVAAMTDFADGYLARRWAVTTKLGSFLDTTADKLLVTGPLIALVEVRP